MDILNDTPFSFGCIAGRMPFPGHSLTLIVKGTFDLVPDGEAVPSEDQPVPTGDEFYEDDEEMRGGPRYASDFAYYKPLADLMLVGHCHAPKDSLVPARRVSFQVGDDLRSLVVYGDRHWTGPIATAPEPFSRLELRYDRSYGGRGFEKNPAGLGYAKTEDPEGNLKRYLPNIMRPDEQLSTPFSRLAPTGFGPVNREWPLRKSRLGAYKGSYLKNRWPWFAEDMDWRYFNAAPDGLQTNYLKGDETLYFENLHPEHQNYRCRLAGTQTRCFVNTDAATGSTTANFLEVAMNLDTLWVDMDREKVVLVWRGWTPVLSEEFEEIRHILIAVEPLTQQPAAVSDYEKLLHRKLIEEEEKWEEAEPPQEPQPQIDEDADNLIAEAEAAYRKAMIAAGLDPDDPPAPSAEDKARHAEMFNALGVDLAESAEIELTRERVVAQFSATKDLSGIDLSGLDLAGVDFRGGNLQATILANADLSGALLDEADLKGAMLAKANLTDASLKKAELSDADFSASHCARIDLCEATMTDAVFDDAILEGAKIDNAQASGASFIQADLTDARLVGSKLSGADLSACELDRADLTGADLAEATLEGSKGSRVIMDGADLTELRASEKSNFAGGSFKRVTARESIWEMAELKGADFSFSKMEGASFAKADLTSASLRAADLKHSRFERADLSDADLALANLLESSFENARLTRCDFRNANLYGSEFLNAIVEDAAFENANLKMTKLSES